MHSTKLLALLALTACAPTTENQADALPFGQLATDGLFTLESTDMVFNQNQYMTVTNASPNATVYIVRSLQGTGSGSCPGFLGGSCFDLAGSVKVHTTATTNNAGKIVTSWAVPEARAMEGRDICFQAVERVQGSPAIMSNAVCVGLGYDADRDKVVDHNDQCEGHDDYYDWDDDRIPDGCDTEGRPPVFDTSEYSVELSYREFMTRDIVEYIPNNPVGIIFAFHGTAGDPDFIDTPETRYGMQPFIDAGFGIVAVDAKGRKWITDKPTTNNDDWTVMTAVRNDLIARGEMNQNTPIVGLGFSNGASMASYMGHAGIAAGWPIVALSYHNHAGRTSHYGAAPDVPSIFIGAVNDTTVDPVTVVDRFDEHRAAGFPGIHLEHREGRLAPTRFARSSFIPQNTSLVLHELVSGAGFFNGQGRPTYSGSAADAVDAMAALPDFDPPHPAKGVLKTILALHVYNGEFGEVEADYFLDQL